MSGLIVSLIILKHLRRFNYARDCLRQYLTDEDILSSL